MTYNFKPCKTISLRDAGVNEKWLQDQIYANPSILGLGDAVVIEKERSQMSGGRLDFLLVDPTEKIRYVVEVMLGPLDASHLVRSIEYWDIEKRRYPNFEHRAVIVSEEITSRFFNVISLLQRAVPFITIQLNAFVAESDMFLNFVRVLDFSEQVEDEELAGGATKSRDYWAKTNPDFISIFDKICALVPKARVAYNQSHIAVGTTGNNFTWFNPRKRSNLYWEISVVPENREKWLDQLEGAGFIPNTYGSDRIRLLVTLESVTQHETLIKKILEEAEEYSK